MPLRKFHGRKVRRAALLGAVIVGLVSCTALPEGSLDPMVPALGLPSKEEATVAQPRGEPWAPAGTATRVPSELSRQFQPRGEPPASTQWIGQYGDNRGQGEIAFTLTRDGSALAGIWRLRTGGSGTMAGTIEPGGRSFVFTLQGSNHECPGALAGRGEYLPDAIRGAYTGSDCVGTITGGSLELRRQ
ncbi:MAG: hypothetical protein KGJ27_09320 [candidate division NC10 bacterium]|nr:hypothetical protein [candidate division NC10 bacterium]